MRAGRADRAHLPADAGSRQAGDGAELRRAAAAAGPDRTRQGARAASIIVPTGALLGLDAVAAAAEGNIHSVRMTTRKPPVGLAGAPYLVQARHLGRRAQRGQARVLRQRARSGRRLPGQRQCRGRAVARRHRAGPHHDRHLGRSGGRRAIATPSRSRPTARASRCRSRTSRRKIRRPAGSSRCRCWRRCASWPRRCGSGPSPYRSAGADARQSLKSSKPFQAGSTRIAAGLRRVDRRLDQLQRRDVARAIGKDRARRDAHDQLRADGRRAAADRRARTAAVPLTRSRFGLPCMAMNSRPTFGLTSEIAEALEHAVAVVVGKRQLARPGHAHEARHAALERAVRPALRVGGREEEIDRAFDERLVVGGERGAGRASPPAGRRCGGCRTGPAGADCRRDT